MAGKMTTYLRSALLNEVLRGTQYAPPTTVYVSLHTADPTNDGSAGELTGKGGYTRKAISFSAPAADGDWIKAGNDAVVAYAAATEAWGTVSHYAVWDANTGGNCLLYGDLDVAKAIDVDDRLEFGAGKFAVKLQ